VDEHGLPGCSLKVGRAATHFGTLHDEIRKFVDDKPHAFLPEIDREGSRYVVRIRVDRTPPARWSLIVGDFIQNLRASLDHLVWRLVRANGCSPTRRNAFPIHSQKPTPRNRGLDPWNAALQGVHPRARAAINSVQPYQAPNGPRRHILSNLSRLSNEDKHRVVLENVGAIARVPPQLDITPIRDVGGIERYDLYWNRPLKTGDVVLSANIEITGPKPEVHLKGEIPFDVGFGERLVTLDGLADIFDGVDRLIAYFSTVFFGVPVRTRTLGERLGYEAPPS